MTGSRRLCGETQLRVRYAETDTGGVVYHSHYLVYFEVGRTELMRELGVPYRQIEEEEGVVLPVVEAEARYREAARYDDLLRIVTRLDSASGARVRFAYEIVRVADERLLCSGSTVLACIDAASGRPRRLPARLRGLSLAGEGDDPVV